MELANALKLGLELAARNQDARTIATAMELVE